MNLLSYDFLMAVVIVSRALALWDLVEKAPPPRGKQERRKKIRININSPHKNVNLSSKYLILSPLLLSLKMKYKIPL